MSRSNVLRFALVAALACSATAADAKPRHIVVTDFDGLPRELADSGHMAVLTLLLDQYDVVATKRWEAARAKFSNKHGQQGWSQAAKEAGVDAIIEGWVQDEGKHHVLTVSVRDAMTGNEIDSVQVRLKDKGLDQQAQRDLLKQLQELLDFWVNADLKTPDPTLPSVPRIGLEHKDTPADDPRPPHKHAPKVDDGGGDDDDPPAKPTKPTKAKRTRTSEVDSEPTDKPDKTEKADVEKSEKVAKTDDPEAPAADAGDAPKKSKASIIALDDNLTATTLGTDVDLVVDKGPKHPPRKTPRVELAAGMFIQSRGMNWEFDPNAAGGPPSYPSSGLQGVSLGASVYPWPWKKYDGKMSGLGFSFKLNKAIASTLDVQDDTGYGTYQIDHVAFEAGIHYRFPIHELLAIDTELCYGQFNHMLPSDFPSSIEIPDTQYEYIGAGVHVDLYLSERAMVGVGAKYQIVTSAGDMTSEDWYGAGSTNGLSLDANFTIPLPYNLFVRGGIEWRRYFTDFQGSGAVTMNYGVWNVTDTSITGTGQVGIHF